MLFRSRNLKFPVQEKLLDQVFQDLPTLQAVAIRWDDLLFQHRRTVRGQEQVRRPFTPARPQTNRSSNGVPMDLDFTRLTPEESQKRQKEGLCFRCGQKGHIRRNCPTNKNIASSAKTNQPWRRNDRIVAIERPDSPTASHVTYETAREGFQED